MKHVLVLNQYALPREQGGGTRHIDLFSRVPGWRASIIAGNRSHYTQRKFTSTDTHFTLVAVPPQDGSAQRRLASWIAYSFRALVAGVRKHNIDAVYASSPHLLAPLTGWVLAKYHRAAFIVEIRDLWPESFVAAGLLKRGSTTHRALSLLERFVISRADHIVGVTPGWEAYFQRLGVSKGRFSAIPNGTEPSDFALDSGFDRDEMRRRLNISGVTAVFAGAHGPKDGIDQILDAAHELPHINFLLVGDGPSKKASIERAQREMITNVEFRDPVAKSNLAELLACCDIGIHSVTPLPVFELGMSPNKLFDYLASGLPVVSNAGKAVEEIIGKDECGQIAGPDSLARSISRVFAASESERSRWSENAQGQLASRFSRHAAANRLHHVLENVCSTTR